MTPIPNEALASACRGTLGGGVRADQRAAAAGRK